VACVGERRGTRGVLQRDDGARCSVHASVAAPQQQEDTAQHVAEGGGGCWPSVVSAHPSFTMPPAQRGCTLSASSPDPARLRRVRAYRRLPFRK
jgi:hypothetical protein